MSHVVSVLSKQVIERKSKSSEEAKGSRYYGLVHKMNEWVFVFSDACVPALWFGMSRLYLMRREIVSRSLCFP